MPGNTKKKRRKRRGTQGGRISDRAVGRPRNRAEAKQRAQQRRASVKNRGKDRASKSSAGSGSGKTRGERGVPQPASWKGALGKGALASLLFFALFAGLFKKPIPASAGLALATMVFYIPVSYYLDAFMYRRFQRNLERDRAKPPESDGG
jgi:hypothetical protein